MSESVSDRTPSVAIADSPAPATHAPARSAKPCAECVETLLRGFEAECARSVPLRRQLDAAEAARARRWTR